MFHDVHSLHWTFAMDLLCNCVCVCLNLFQCVCYGMYVCVDMNNVYIMFVCMRMRVCVCVCVWCKHAHKVVIKVYSVTLSPGPSQSVWGWWSQVCWHCHWTGWTLTPCRLLEPVPPSSSSSQRNSWKSGTLISSFLQGYVFKSQLTFQFMFTVYISIQIKLVSSALLLSMAVILLVFHIKCFPMPALYLFTSCIDW